LIIDTKVHILRDMGRFCVKRVCRGRADDGIFTCFNNLWLLYSLKML
jgi:hypothetical protein